MATDSTVGIGWNWKELQASASDFRLGQSLRAALRRPGPVGRRLRPGGLLAVAALHLLPGLLSHLLVGLHPAGAAVPGDSQGRYDAAAALVSLYFSFKSHIYLCIIALRGSPDGRGSSLLEQIAFLGLTSAERTTLTFQQRKLKQSVSLRQNPYK